MSYFNRDYEIKRYLLDVLLQIEERVKATGDPGDRFAGLCFAVYLNGMTRHRAHIMLLMAELERRFWHWPATSKT